MSSTWSPIATPPRGPVPDGGKHAQAAGSEWENRSARRLRAGHPACQAGRMGVVCRQVPLPPIRCAHHAASGRRAQVQNIFSTRCSMKSTTLADAAAIAPKRCEILSGGLAPAAAASAARPLRQRFGIGATPLREALARLAAEGFVVAEGPARVFRAPRHPRASRRYHRQPADRRGRGAETCHAAWRCAAWEDGIVSFPRAAAGRGTPPQARPMPGLMPMRRSTMIFTAP